MITRCSNCGTPLTHEHVTGIYIKCPNCNREQILSDLSQAMSPGSSEPHYYDDNLPWPDFLDKCFDKETLKKLPYGFLNSDNVTTKEFYVPFVEISHRNGSDFMPVHTIQPQNPFIPTLHNTPKIKQAKRLTAPPYNARVLSVDPAKTNISNSPERYVNPELKYFPVKSLIIKHDKTYYQTFAVGNHIEHINSELPENGWLRDQELAWKTASPFFYITWLLIIASLLCTFFCPEYLPWSITGKISGVWTIIWVGLLTILVLATLRNILKYAICISRQSLLFKDFSNLKSQCKTKTR